LKIVILLYDALTTLYVAVQYLQFKHLVTFAQSRVCIIHVNWLNSYFHYQQQWNVGLRIMPNVTVVLMAAIKHSELSMQHLITCILVTHQN